MVSAWKKKILKFLNLICFLGFEKRGWTARVVVLTTLVSAVPSFFAPNWSFVF